MKHRIVIRCEGRSLRDFALKQQISKCITAALAHQGVNTPCEINVLVTDDEGIRAINNAYRKIDKATDVLSFPMFELTAGQLPASWDAYKDPDTGLVPLGDMAISLERARQQAAEFGHSARREVGYLTTPAACVEVLRGMPSRAMAVSTSSLTRASPSYICLSCEDCFSASLSVM